MSDVSSGGFLLATAVGILLIAMAGGVLYGVVFADLFRANFGSATGVMKSPDFLWIALAHMPFGLLLSLVVLWRGDLTLRGGAFAGATLGLLMAAGYDFSQYGTTNLWSMKLTLVDPFISMTMVAIAGAAVGPLLGRARRVGEPDERQ